jgi:IS4 transposase
MPRLSQRGSNTFLTMTYEEIKYILKSTRNEVGLENKF